MVLRLPKTDYIVARNPTGSSILEWDVPLELKGRVILMDIKPALRFPNVATITANVTAQWGSAE